LQDEEEEEEQEEEEEEEEEEARSGHDEEEEAGAEHEEEEHEDEDDEDGGSEEVIRVRLTRKSHYVHPPPVPAPADRKLIIPIGDRYVHYEFLTSIVCTRDMSSHSFCFAVNGRT
jgi:hypothetical protein